MSDLLSPNLNPRGWFLPNAATAICGLLLFPSVALFIREFGHLRYRWGLIGAWLYCVGLLAVISIGVSAPFQHPYSPVHLSLAYVAFLGLPGGLALCHIAVACSLEATRLWHAVLAALLTGAFAFVAFLVFDPPFFDGRRWMLAVLEWTVSWVVAASILSLVWAASKVRQPPGHTGQMDRSPNQSEEVIADPTHSRGIEE